VVSNGKVIAREGELLASPRLHQFRTRSLNSVRLKHDIKPGEFKIQVENDTDTVPVRVIDLITDLVTAESIVQLPVSGGELNPNTEQDVLKVAAIDRTNQPGKIFSGLIKGFGLKSGAMACSAAWDTSDINRIRTLQGGAVVCDKGVILAELALPIFGIMSDLPIVDIARKLGQIRKAASALGVRHPDPLLTLITLTGAAIPYLRICEEGLVNLKDGLTRPLVAS
jgi:adenine deaminase